MNCRVPFCANLFLSTVVSLVYQVQCRGGGVSRGSSKGSGEEGGEEQEWLDTTVYVIFGIACTVAFIVGCYCFIKLLYEVYCGRKCNDTCSDTCNLSNKTLLQCTDEP